MPTQDELKREVARAAVAEIAPWLGSGQVIGVGTGSTADLFIDELALHRLDLAGTVASSQRSADRLARHGIEVLDLNAVAQLPVYVDGADEVTERLHMIKGGGGAHTREKIVAAVAERFICIADGSKLVDRLGRFPLPLEVIPMARGYVARSLMKLLVDRFPSVEVELRERADGGPFRTDNGNWILDVHGLVIDDPEALERELDGIVGVVTNGLFALRGADVCLLARPDGVSRLDRSSRAVLNLSRPGASVPA